MIDEPVTAIAENTSDAIVTIDSSSTIQFANQAVESLFGYKPEELEGDSLTVLMPTRYHDEHLAAVDRFLDTGEQTLNWQNIEFYGEHQEGHEIPLSVSFGEFEQNGEKRFVGVIRDISSRKLWEERLSGLNEMLADFLETETKQAICNIAVEAAQSALTIPVTMIARFDEEEGSLRPTARTPAAQKLLDAQQLLAQDGAAWQTFASSDPTVLDISNTDLVAVTDAIDRLAVYPLGSHGVFITGLPADGITDAQDDFINTVLTDLEAALNRIEREKLLHEREAILEERTKHLERVDRINTVIRTIDRALVAAASRDEIEHAICQELAQVGPYLFAWIGEYDVATNLVEPREHAGAGDGYLDAVSVTVDDDSTEQNPTAAAVQSRNVQVVESMSTDPPYEPWREAALSRGFRAAIALPITYRNRLYGVLTLYADHSDLVGELERTVLEELADNIGQAINAVETQRALVSDSIVELELRVPAKEVPFLEIFHDDSGCNLDIEMIVPDRNGVYRVFLIAEDVIPADRFEAMDETPHIKEWIPASQRGDSRRFECLVTHESLIAWLLDHGATPQSITVTDHEGDITVHLPSDEDVRRFVESFQTRYADAQLVARRQRERAVQTGQDFTAELEARLTTRQREILRLAYVNGYFESPREQTASDLASSLNISQPAFTNHLRAGQRKLFDMLYGNEEPR